MGLCVGLLLVGKADEGEADVGLAVLAAVGLVVLTS